MPSHKVIQCHQDGTIEAWMQVNTAGSAPAFAKWVIPISRDAEGLGHKIDGKLVYGPANGRYFLHVGAEMIEIDFAPESIFKAPADVFLEEKPDLSFLFKRRSGADPQTND